jgi:hypothetical protein
MSLSSQTLIKMGFQQHRPTITYEDFEAAAVELSKETRSGSALRWHFIAERQSTQVDDLTVVNRRRNKVIAGFLVSPRAAPTLDAFHDHILGHNPRSWLMTTSKTLSSVKVRGRTILCYESPDLGPRAAAIVRDVATQAPAASSLRLIRGRAHICRTS